MIQGQTPKIPDTQSKGGGEIWAAIITLSAITGFVYAIKIYYDYKTEKNENI